MNVPGRVRDNEAGAALRRNDGQGISRGADGCARGGSGVERDILTEHVGLGASSRVEQGAGGNKVTFPWWDVICPMFRLPSPENWSATAVVEPASAVSTVVEGSLKKL